jgi:hypothetical protein
MLTGAVGNCVRDVSISTVLRRNTANLTSSTMINIAVFVIWIPAHLVPPPIPL